MAVVALFVMALWTLVVVRAVAARASLSTRTFAVYLVLGFLLSVTTVPIFERLAQPYPEFSFGELGPFTAEALSLARLVVLAVPVVLYLSLRELRLATSVADAFFLAFLIGFGFELTGSLLAVSEDPSPIDGLSVFPPFQFRNEDLAVAGMGYWLALMAIGSAAALRFIRHKWWSRGVIIILLFLVATEQASLLVPDRGLLKLFGTLTGHGRFTALTTLVATALLSVLEASWTRRHAGEVGVTRWGRISDLLIQGHLRQAREAYVRMRLERQVALAEAEAEVSPGDPVAPVVAQGIRGRLGGPESGPRTDASAQTIRAPRGSMVQSVVSHAWAPVLLVFILVFLPRLPDRAPELFWDFPVLSWQLFANPITLLNVGLTAVVLWRFRRTGGGLPDASSPDDTIRRQAERLVMFGCLGAVLLVVAYMRVDQLYPWPSVVASFAGRSFPPYEPLQVSTMLMLLSVAASSGSGDLRSDWERMDLHSRRHLAMRNVLTVVGAFAVTWISLAVYTVVVETIHPRLGRVLFDLFGQGGNVAAAIAAAIVTGATAFAFGFLFHTWGRRIEQFFLGEGPA